MMFYCLNMIFCCWMQLLGYFGEDFNVVNCNKQCDFCFFGEKVIFKQVDCIDWVKVIIDLIFGMGVKGGFIGKFVFVMVG